MHKNIEKQTQAKVEFSIFGDEMDFNAVSNQLGINPTRVWRKGDAIKDGNIVRKESCWEYSSEYEDCLDVYKLVEEKIIVLFEDKTEAIREICNQYNLTAKMDIVVEVYGNQTPGIGADKRLVSFLYAIDAEIDIDLYII